MRISTIHITTRDDHRRGGVVRPYKDNVWGGNQVIDGVTYRTYCGGNGDCTHTNWAGGTLGPRLGWRCFVLQP